MARVVRMHGFGGPEVLSLDEVNVRDPGRGEVQIKVGAIGLNRAETLILSGAFGQKTLPSNIGRTNRTFWSGGNPLVLQTVPGITVELQHFTLKDEAAAGRVTFLNALTRKGVKTDL